MTPQQPVHATGAIILAGGRGRRLRRDKGLVLVEGTPIVVRVLRAARAVAARIVVVGSEAIPTDTDVSVIPDEVPGAGPAHGLLVGLQAVGCPVALLVAWDMPFVEAQLLRFIAEQVGEYEAAVPVVGGQPEPLCAAYRQSCVPVLEALNRGVNVPMREVLVRLRVRWIEEHELRSFGDPTRLFFNVNTAADLATAQKMASGE